LPTGAARAPGCVWRALAREHEPAAQALTLERERRQAFVATLAHELGQPLSAISAAVASIRVTPGHVAPVGAIESLERQIGQMSRAVEDLLDESRWACGKMALRTESLDIGALVNEAALDVGAEVAVRRHVLVVTVPPAPLYAMADRERLQQVLSNLLRNAVQYTEPGGRITVDAERRGAMIVVRVTDTGRGLAPDVVPHIFGLFSQVRPAEQAGVGIGLSVSREVMALHGGRIDARSDGVGHGSEFIVTVAPACAFLIRMLPPLEWGQPDAGPLPADADDPGDLARLDDDGGVAGAPRPGERSASVPD
jgi:signal transduction histidine kinase